MLLIEQTLIIEIPINMTMKHTAIIHQIKLKYGFIAIKFHHEKFKIEYKNNSKKNTANSRSVFSRGVMIILSNEVDKVYCFILITNCNKI